MDVLGKRRVRKRRVNISNFTDMISHMNNYVEFGRVDLMH